MSRSNVNVLILQISSLIRAHNTEPDQRYDDPTIEPRTLLQKLGNNVFRAREEQNKIVTSSGRSDTKPSLRN